MEHKKEHRRAHRSKHDSVIEFLGGSAPQILAIGRLIDVSTVGVCFTTSLVLEKGQTIRARLRLVKEGRFEIMGHVVWIKKKLNQVLYGVEFDKTIKR